MFSVPPISRTPLISRLAPGDAALPNRTAALVDAINGHLRPRIDQFRQLTGAAVVFYANRRALSTTLPTMACQQPTARRCNVAAPVHEYRSMCRRSLLMCRCSRRRRQWLQL